MKATTSTHQARAIPAERFRAQATGCSPCTHESAEEGAARAARVVECMPPAQRRALAPSAGYPGPGLAGAAVGEPGEGLEYLAK